MHLWEQACMRCQQCEYSTKMGVTSTTVVVGFPHQLQCVLPTLIWSVTFPPNGMGLQRQSCPTIFGGAIPQQFLQCISPTGAIIFPSKCWGSCVSDKRLTDNSGFLDHFQHGDLALGDWGFDKAVDLALHGASLDRTPYIKGKLQLHVPQRGWNIEGL